jgi:hypothetical protein
MKPDFDGLATILDGIPYYLKVVLKAMPVERKRLHELAHLHYCQLADWKKTTRKDFAMFLHQKYFVTRINVITEFGKK